VRVKIIETAIPGVKIIEPRVFGDDRGFFMESWSRRTFADAGLTLDFVQDNHSRSRRGVLRGLHYQLGRPQAKLVRATVGRVWDVAVDIRRGSPTFGRSVGVELTAENHRMLFAPRGFAHGFVVLSEVAEFQYKVDDFYAPEEERSVHWADPELAIPWPLDDALEPVLSAKDATAPTMAAVDADQLPIYREESP
jgi:dTDP-4-dehydrorhamnose 3,5-epimerase